MLVFATITPAVAVADNESGSFASRMCRLGFARLVAKETPAMAAAKARAAQRAIDRSVAVDSRVGIDGIQVREVDGSAPEDFIPVTPDEFMKLYGELDPKKIIKAKDVLPQPVQAKKSDPRKWFRSIIDLGDGRFGSVNYTIIETKPSGKVVIKFENPLHRGQVETRELRPADLQRGLKELEAAPKDLTTPGAL